MRKKSRILKIHLNVKLTLLIVGLFFTAIIFKLSYVVISQKVDGINLTEFASNRNTVKETIYAERGTIYDSEGNPLAKNANSYNIIAFLSPSRTTDINEPQHVIDKNMTANSLCGILAHDENSKKNCLEDITSYLNQDLYQAELGSWGKISEEEKRAIEALELPGISFQTLAKKRQYINSSWASYILGYARSDEDGNIKGELGVEGYFDDELKGTDGFVEYQKDAYGYQMANTPENRIDAISGSDIYLTINSDIQNVLENAIATFSKNNQMDWALVTVMDATNGNIVGAATNPSFNPNNLEGLNNYLNPLVGYQYEPGSTMKTFNWMAAMENGIYDGNATFLSGSLKLQDGTLVNDFIKSGWGVINFDTAYAYSSNVGAATLALKLGASKLTDFYNLCGFGSKTGITLPAEEDGLIDFYYESELANASFGQGVLVTPVQMLQGLSIIANNGVMLKPQIVSKIVDQDGNVTYEAKRTEVRKVTSEQTANKMRNLMYKVVYEGFDYNLDYSPSNIKLIGKTGTAEIASDTGGYMTGYNDYIRSFAGMFPYENPKYIIYFATKRNTDGNIPKTISSLVDDIARVTNLINSKNDVDDSKIVLIPQYINTSVDYVKEDTKKKKITAIILSNGKNVINQYPPVNTKTIDTSKIFIMTDGNEIKMPDVINWSTNEIIRFCNFIGLNYILKGYGKVKNTNIPKDTIIDVKKMKMEIELG